MIEIPGRIPISIHPLFWLLAALIGWINAQGSLLGVVIWVGIIFFSVLFHEYGHAVTSVWFRQTAKIQLVAMGGVTSYTGPKLKFWQQFLIVLNGPIFGFLLFLGASAWLSFGVDPGTTLYVILKITQVANLFWTVVNLLPVLPLDGGQLLRIVLEAMFGVKGFKASLLIGAGIAFACSFAFFIMQFFLAGALFFLFAFQSFDLWRKSRFVMQIDREEEFRKSLIQGEMALQAGKKPQAKELFAKVHAQAKGGLLATVAAQHLALLCVEEGKRKEAYDLLLPIEPQLADETRVLLHQLAFEEHNDSLVAKLSSICYQFSPTQEMALRNARVFARLKEPKLAGGWLQKAWQHGGLKMDSILQEVDFAALKGNADFEEFIQKLL